jgi:ABC-type nitrate/sulfonate/bicarbonate transport system permease component
VTRAKWRNAAYGTLGIALFLGAWEMVGVYRLAGMTWPSFSATLAFTLDPSRQALFTRAIQNTFSMAALGYVLGALAGIALGALGTLVRPLRPGLDRLVSVIHAIPSIALAPVFIMLLDRDSTGAAIAAMIVGYTLYVATTSGLAAASATHHDVFSAFGASRVARLWRLELPAALPALAGGLKLAIPGAFIGAIIGEWFGASRGLGLLMVSAMHNFQITLLWSAVLITGSASLLLFGLATWIERRIAERFRA